MSYKGASKKQTWEEDMAERAAIVTGGASGIGKATAELLAGRGWAVAIADVNEAEGRAIADRITAAGGEAIFVLTDVRDEDAVRHLVNQSVESFSRLDGAVNCAGVAASTKRIHEMEAGDWDRCLDINLRGMFLCMKYQIDAMRASGGGAIVAISSAAAQVGSSHSAEYCASKAGILGLVRGAACDCAKYNIRVNAVLPGATDTPLAAAAMGKTADLANYRSWPLARFARAEEIASAAVWLLSDEATFATGACIPIDGGMTAA